MRFLLSLIFVLLTASVFAQSQDSEKAKLRKSVFFGGGSYYISDEQVASIRNFILEFENLENYEITIAGHTDNIGGKEYNEWLSYMRSNAVKGELIKIEIPAEMIHIKEFGEDNPLYDNRSRYGKNLNRRVDIILTPIVF